MSEIKWYNQQDCSILVCHGLRGKEAEAGKVRLEEYNGKWHFWLLDLNSGKYLYAGMYDSYDEAYEKVGGNNALRIVHGKWLERQKEFRFLAMQYNDEELEAFAVNHMKPAVIETLFV